MLTYFKMYKESNYLMISIITLCYNQLENATKPFIKSLYEYTDEKSFELIVVNNNSNDGTKEYLEELSKEKNNIKIINNNENFGYAKGNNQGLKIAKGDYLFLLNNDLLFTPNWLDNMLSILKNNKKIGILAPITNNCGSPKQIIEGGAFYTPDNYLAKLSNLTLDKNKFFYADRVVFFCWAMRREVFKKVGFLDEKFGLAWFEDDDYTLRVIYKGFKSAVAEGIFIFHNHSQTSKKLEMTDFGKELFEKNKKYFKRKHKIYFTLKKIKRIFKFAIK